MTEIYQHRDGSVLAIRTLEIEGAARHLSIRLTGREPAILDDLLHFNFVMYRDECLTRAEKGPSLLLSSGEHEPILLRSGSEHEPFLLNDLTHVGTIYRHEIHLSHSKIKEPLRSALGMSQQAKPPA